MSLAEGMTNNIIAVDGRVYSTDAHDRGMGRYVTFLIEVLADAGYDIVLILYQRHRVITTHKLAMLCTTTESVSLDPGEQSEQDYHNSSLYLETLLRSIDVSCYIDATPFLEPKRYAITACPVIAIAYDLIPLRYQSHYFTEDSGHVEAYRNGLYRLKSADHVVAISEFTRDGLAKYLGMNKQSISLLYPKLADHYCDQDLTSKKKVCANTIFSIVGGHHSKNTDGALAIILALKKRYNIAPKITVPTSAQCIYLLIKYKHLLEKLKIKAEISERKKIRYQLESQCVMHLSLEEGFGIPLLEALFLDTKVVCCDVAVNREILSKGDNDSSIALFVSLDDAEHDYESIVNFIRSPATERSKHAFAKIKDFFIRHWNIDAKAIIKSAIDKAHLQYKKKLENIKLCMHSNLPGHYCGVADYAASIPIGVPGNMIVYTADARPSQLDKHDNVIIKSQQCFHLDLKMNLPSVYHLAVSDPLWFGIENLRVYGSLMIL